MGTFSIWHWLVVLAVLVLVFGTKKLRGLGGDLGAAVRGFKQGVKGDEKTDAIEDAQAVATAAAAEQQPAAAKPEASAKSA